MGQQNSKKFRERDDLEEEDENKVQDEIKKLKKKNVRKEAQSKQTQDENKELEHKLFVADQETSQANIATEITCPSSSRLTGIEPEQGKNEKDKRDSHCDEAGIKETTIFNGSDFRECVYLHSHSSNEHIVVHSALLEPESSDFTEPGKYGNHLYGKASLHSSEEKKKCVLDETKADKTAKRPNENQEMGAPKADLDGYGSVVKSISKEEYESSGRKSCITGENAVRSKLHIPETYSIFNKLFCETDEYHLLNKNVSLKFLVDNINIRVSAYWYPVSRHVYEHVYAVSFNGGPMLLRTYGDKQEIKRILLMPNLRQMYLADEHFRLATFSLYEFNYEMGKLLSLAGSGYFCDIDGTVKCFCCGNTYLPDVVIRHQPTCTLRYDNRSIADNYGTSASNWLVPSGRNEQVGNREGEFIDIHLRLTTTSVRLGRTQQVIQNNAVTQDSEERDNTDFISVRDPESSRDESSHMANIDMPLQNNCEGGIKSEYIALPSSDLISVQRQQDPFKGNQMQGSVSDEREASNRRAGRSGMCTVDQSEDEGPPQQVSQNPVIEPPSHRQRSIKEDVNREKSKEAARRCKLDMENQRFRSGMQCCICRRRQCNIVLLPCGHLVVCDHCIASTTYCPKCRKKVDNAFTVSD